MWGVGPFSVWNRHRCAKDTGRLSQAYDAYQKLWDRLDAGTAAKVKSANFERIFDTARKKVRAWEAAQKVIR